MIQILNALTRNAASSGRKDARLTNCEVCTMMNAIARRLRRLEELAFQQRAETGPDLVAILLERRRKRAIAEGREPEPDPPPGRLIDSKGRPFSLADVMLQHRKKRETS
jgi:hypothetical protein